jgi:WD40 repeat protein
MQYDKWHKSSKIRLPVDGGLENPLPTTCCFMNNDQLVCGFNDSYLSVFDLNKNTFTSNIKTFKNEKNEKIFNMAQHQANYLINSNSVPTLYGGFEDCTIKSIDMRSDSVTNSFTAHTDSVTSLSLFNDLYLFSTSHDTKIRMWDIRYLSNCLQETIGSQKKWDEAMWHSIIIPNQLILATGKLILFYSLAGADSVIKLFKL